MIEDHAFSPPADRVWDNRVCEKCPEPAERHVWRTDNGVPVTEGLRVFTNDWAWGTVVKANAHYSHGMWHLVELDSGRRATYNVDRITTRHPDGEPDPRRSR